MTDTKNHPLEDLLDLDQGSTPPKSSIFDENAPVSATNTPSDEMGPDIPIEEFYEKDDSLDAIDQAIAVSPSEQFYDHIDKKVEQKYQEVYNYSLSAYSDQVQEAGLVEGRFRARNLEVAAQFLRIALDSAKDAGNQKANKDKVKVAEKKMAATGGGTVNNNLFVGDRNDLLRALADAEKKSTKIIDQEDNN